MLSDPIHWATEPAPLDEDRNISFFYWKVVLLGHNKSITHSTIFWAFMTIVVKVTIILYLVSHEPTFCSLQKSFASVVKLIIF